MDNNQKITVSFNGLFMLTFIILLILKLGGIIDISWWLVTLPLWYWIPILVFVVFIGIPIYLLIRCIIFEPLYRLIKLIFDK